MKAIVFEARRDGYGIEQIADRAMTVEELREFLEDKDDEDIIVMSHDGGYTYGSISTCFVWGSEEQEDGHWKDYDIW